MVRPPSPSEVPNDADHGSPANPLAGPLLVWLILGGGLAVVIALLAFVLR